MKINVKGVIIPNEFKAVYDFLEIDAVCPGDVQSAIDRAGGGEVNVYVNSGGGDLYAGLEIYSALREYTGRVNVHITGRAHSAASFLACVGKSDITPGGTVMIHNVSAAVQGDFRSMGKAAEVLRVNDVSIAGIYAAKTGKEEGEILALIDSEKWFTAEQSVEIGLVDSIAREAVRPVAAEYVPIPLAAVEKIRNILKNPPENEADNSMRRKAQAQLNLLKLQGGQIN